MAGFTKLFSEIVTSSIWCEDDKTRLVWVTLLALAGPDGVAKAALPGLAHAARVTLEECQMAMDKLQSPDPFSRSKEYEGRRVKEVDGGYQLLNYLKYRETMDSEERRMYKAYKQRQYRNRKKEIVLEAQKDGAKQALVEGFASLKNYRPPDND
jgi:hypothetical protein